jgi:hypothetical protein
MTRRVLLQLDADPQPSTFDAIVAVDAGVDVLLRHGGVTPESAVPLVHGGMFTRGGKDLASTAIFVGGSDVPAAEAIFRQVQKTFFGPVRVGVMLDPSGANTTAAAAVVVAARHANLANSKAVVLGGSGPVGRRVVRLLARQGCVVGVASRSVSRAEAVCQAVASEVSGAQLQPVEATTDACGIPHGPLCDLLGEADVVVAAGAAGIRLLGSEGRRLCGRARVFVDLNAVPPEGIEGIQAADTGRVLSDDERGAEMSAVAYGALGVGGVKMKIHREAVRQIFTSNSACLDAEEMLEIGRTVS